MMIHHKEQYAALSDMIQVSILYGFLLKFISARSIPPFGKSRACSRQFRNALFEPGQSELPVFSFS